MASHKLIALGILIIQIHGRDAVHICLGNNNPNINQNSPILTTQRQQQIVNNNNKQCSPMTNINNKVIEVKRQQPNNGNIGNVPLKLKQMNLQPLTTSMSKVSAVPVGGEQVRQTSPSQTVSLETSTPAASPVTSLLAKSCGCNKSKQTSVHVCSQQQNRNVPSTLVSNNQCQCQSTPITLTFSNIHTENPSIQIQPAVSCVQAQSNSGPLRLTVDTTRNPTLTICGQNSPSTVQNQPSVVAVNQPAMPENQAAVAPIQETPVVQYAAPVQTQFLTASEPRNEIQSIYTSQQPYASQPQFTPQSHIPSRPAYPTSAMFPSMPPPNQKTSNLKLLLPLLFNLLKENNMNCGCQSHCNCNCNKYCNRNFHNYDYEPQVFSGYSNSASFGQNTSSQFGPLSSILGSDEYDILSYPGPFRERKINSSNKNSEENESQENDISEESKTEMNEIDDGYSAK